MWGMKYRGVLLSNTSPALASEGTGKSYDL